MGRSLAKRGKKNSRPLTPGEARILKAAEDLVAAIRQAYQGEPAPPVDNSEHPDFHTRIDHLPQAIQVRLCECSNNPGDASLTREYTHLVCNFGDMKGRPAVQYLYGDEALRAAVLSEDRAAWAEIGVMDFAVQATRMRYKAWVAKFGTALPPFPDWLFYRLEGRRRR